MNEQQPNNKSDMTNEAIQWLDELVETHPELKSIKNEIPEDKLEIAEDILEDVKKLLGSLEDIRLLDWTFEYEGVERVGWKVERVQLTSLSDLDQCHLWLRDSDGQEQPIEMGFTELIRLCLDYRKKNQS